MPFDELIQGKRINDPEARKAEELTRSNGRRKQRLHRTSVSLNTMRVSIIALKVLVTVLAIVLVGAVIVLGYRTYLGL